MAAASLSRSYTYARELAKVKTIMEYAMKYKAVDRNYRFEKIRDHHMPQLMDLSRGFFEDESVTNATGSTIDNCKKGMENVFEYCIACNHICEVGEICYEKKTNKPIGFRLGYPSYRDEKKAPFVVPKSTLSKQETTLFTPLDAAFSKIWELFPEEEVVFKADVIYVNRAYRKDGLLQVWIDGGMDYPTLAERCGANIYVVMCTARQTKGWYEKLGYTKSYVSQPFVEDALGKKVNLPQGEICLYTANLHTTRSINVRPYWEEMRATGLIEE